jgi:hypothetical protein
MRARHELLPLTFPVLLCVAAWGVILTRPAARAHVVPQPRAAVVMPRPPHRPPSPAPREAVETTAPAAPAEAVTAATSPAVAPAVERVVTPNTASVEELTISISGESGWDGGDYSDDNWRWSPAGLAWSHRYFYYRRESEARYRAWREARRRRPGVMLAPGSAAMGAAQDDPPSLCEVFGAACSSGSPSRTVAPPPAEPIAATIRRDGRRWTLANGTVEATIDPDALCEMAVHRLARRDDELPPFTFATPSSATCEVTETAAPDTAVEHGAVAVALTWRGNGWWQQAIVSLRDDGASPEASLTRTERVGSTMTTEVSNLTAGALTWTLGGREHTVAPRAVLQLRS